MTVYRVDAAKTKKTVKKPSAKRYASMDLSDLKMLLRKGQRNVKGDYWYLSDADRKLVEKEIAKRGKGKGLTVVDQLDRMLKGF